MIKQVNKIIRMGSTVVAISIFMAGAAFAKDKKAEIMTELARTYPKMHVDSLEESPIKGLYEIIAGDQVFYYGESGHLFFGEIWTKEGRSLTAEKRKIIMESKIKKLPLDLAIKTGNGPKTVIEFTDPDCPYCRKMDDFLSKRNDITRYTFFMPLRQIHPNAAKKAEYIITAKDQDAAFKDVFSGKIQAEQITADRSTKESQKRLADMERLAQSMGVKGTPALWIEGVFVNGANTDAATKILDGRGAAKLK